MTDDQVTDKAVELYRQTRNLDAMAFRNALTVAVSRIDTTKEDLAKAKAIPAHILKIAQANAQATEEQQEAGQALLDGLPSDAQPADIKNILDKINGLRPRPMGGQRPVGV